MWKRALCTALLLHVSASGQAAETAEPFPTKPIRVVLGFAPGGTDDFLARSLGPKLTERLGQPVIVDNRPGAGGNLGAELTARSNPDGHTLYMGPISQLATSRTLYPKLSYDLLRDFAFVSQLASGSQVLVANVALPAKSVKELIALAKAKPNGVRYGSAGIASSSHLATEMLRSRAGIEILHVPYKSGSLISAALLAGEVDISFASVGSLMSLIKAKRVNALAVSGDKRVAALPDVPTVAESGLTGFNADPVYGALAPAKTPAAVIKVLNTTLGNILRTEEIRSLFAASALVATPSTPDELRAIARAQVERWAKVIKEAGISVN